MLMQSKTRLVSKVVRSFSSTTQLHKSHYDVLEITPKATQSDIKSAYYKLSKIYHPDKSSDEESAKKFRALTEAYEVLGNIKLKKMYDKGLLVGKENTSRMDYHPEPDPTDPTLRFYKSRVVRHTTPTMDGKTPIYDFDSWSKSHYGDLFHKSQYNKDLLKKKRAKQLDESNAVQQEIIFYAMLTMTVLFVLLVAYGKSDYDQDNINNKNKAEIESQTKEQANQ